eukprot:161712-Rhodomonas_salina.1
MSLPSVQVEALGRNWTQARCRALPALSSTVTVRYVTVRRHTRAAGRAAAAAFGARPLPGSLTRPGSHDAACAVPGVTVTGTPGDGWPPGPGQA